MTYASDNLETTGLYIDNTRYLEHPFSTLFFVPSPQFFKIPRGLEVSAVTEEEKKDYQLPYNIESMLSLTIGGKFTKLINILDVYSDIMVWVRYLTLIGCRVLYMTMGERKTYPSKDLTVNEIIYQREIKHDEPCLS